MATFAETSLQGHRPIQSRHPALPMQWLRSGSAGSSQQRFAWDVAEIRSGLSKFPGDNASCDWPRWPHARFCKPSFSEMEGWRGYQLPVASLRKTIQRERFFQHFSWRHHQAFESALTLGSYRTVRQMDKWGSFGQSLGSASHPTTPNFWAYAHYVVLRGVSGRTLIKNRPQELEATVRPAAESARAMPGPGPRPEPG